MAKLQQKLDVIRAGFEKQAPAEALEIMHRVTNEQVASGQAGRAIGEGDAAPSFSLPDQDGNLVSSADLLAKGPLVLSFFRGHW